MFKNIFINFCLFNICFGTFNNNIIKEWNDYKIKFRKDYTPLEEIYRKTIWYTNRNLINLHNLRFNQNLISFKLSVNQFSDMSLLEYSKIFQKNNNLFRRTESFQPLSYEDVFEINNKTIPTSIDWRNRNAITKVKNQGTICNTGWAFASLAALESHHFFRFGEFPPELSAQNLIDCVQESNTKLSSSSTLNQKLTKNAQIRNSICGKAQTPNDAFEYIIQNQNVNTELLYPYENGRYEKCHYNPDDIGATCAAIRYLPEGRDDYLAGIVGTVGPVIIGYDPASFCFMHYASGIYDEPTSLSLIPRNPLNHFLTVVGYGNDTVQGDYWIVKNSFGNSWGENGYIRISRKKERPISKLALYPIV